MQARFLWRALKARWRDQKAELAIIRAHIRPGDTVCDIGAHKGTYLFWLSRWVRHGRVVAFEPQPSLADYLRKLIARMHVTNVTLEQKGVSSFTGQQTFFIPAPNSPGASLVQSVGSSETGQHLTIDVVALDDYFAANEKISLIKIDAEGAELAIFEGATRLLKEQRPVLVLNAKIVISKQVRCLTCSLIWRASAIAGSLTREHYDRLQTSIRRSTRSNPGRDSGTLPVTAIISSLSQLD
jgi:FkbM family methyltransferase